MKENFEKYISELPKELQEKARQCKTKEEFNTLIAENDVELSDDALEMVSGGCGVDAACCHWDNCKTTITRDRRDGQENSRQYSWFWKYCTICKGDYYFFQEHGGDPIEITKEQYDAAYDPTTGRTVHRY